MISSCLEIMDIKGEHIRRGKMKEILFATGNASKVDRFFEKLQEKGILLKSDGARMAPEMFQMMRIVQFL